MKTPILILLITTSLMAWSQEGSYIIKREVYKNNLTSINFSPDGKYLLTGFQDGSFRLLDPESFETKLEVLNAHYKAVNAMEMPPKMDFILTAGYNAIKLWDMTGKLRANWNGHGTTIWNVDISNDGKHAVSSAFNKTFLLWDVYNSVILEHMREHEDVTMSVCISPDNRWIASGSNDLTIKIWDINTRKVIKTLHGPTQDVYDVAFSPDSRLVAVASKDRSIRIYNLEEEKLIHLLKGHRDMVMEVAFSPDGNYLTSYSDGGIAYSWRGATAGTSETPYTDYVGSLGVCVGTLWDAEFAQDGQLQAIGASDGFAYVYRSKLEPADVSGYQRLHDLAGHDGNVTGVAFNPEGSILATAGSDGTARLWDLDTGDQITTLVDQSVAFAGIDMSPDGRYVLTAGEDGMLRIFLASVEDLMKLARSRLSRGLTNTECQRYLHQPCARD